MKKIFFSFLLAPAILNLNLKGIDEKALIDHVKKSIQNATNGISKLGGNALSIEGMSSPKVRHLLNNVCSLPNVCYLEIGVWKGSTLVAALSNNSSSVSDAIAIDNWSQFSGPRDAFINNVSHFLKPNSVRFYDQDCFAVSKNAIFKKTVDIYFYDGDHIVEAQRLAFTYFNEVFSDTFIAIVDDWNHEPVRIGTRQAFKELNYTVLYEEILPANFNGDMQNWWNGLYVGVIKTNRS